MLRPLIPFLFVGVLGCSSSSGVPSTEKEAGGGGVEPQRGLGGDHTAAEDGGAVGSESDAAPSFEEIFATGLSAYQLPDAEGASCADCHGPSPLGLAYVGYEADVVRGIAALHVPPEAEDSLVALVAALQSKYDLHASNEKAFEDPPFQPGGSAFSGSIPERDLAFFEHLTTLAPSLFGAPIEDLAAAQTAENELFAIELRKLRVGVELPVWSESWRRGESHRSMKEWIPHFPRKPVSDEARAELYALHDAYLEAPTWTKLRAIEEANEELTIWAVPADSFGHGIGFVARQYSAQLQANHVFWLEVEGQIPRDSSPLDFFEGPNHSWNVGEELRMVGLCGRGEEPRSLAGCNGLSAELTQKISTDGSVEILDVEVGWYWLGWLLDPKLQDSSPSFGTRSGRYFADVLYHSGFPLHARFFQARKDLENARARAEGSPRYGSASVYAMGFEDPSDWADPFAHLSEWTAAGRFLPGSRERELLLSFSANVSRMYLQLLLDELKRLGKAEGLSALRVSTAFSEAFPRLFALAAADGLGDSASDTALLDELAVALGTVCEAGTVGCP